MTKERRRIQRTCYLCGVALGRDRTADHVPPRQFFPEAFRKCDSPQLVTLPVHSKCNAAFHRDEEYVVTTLAGFAAGTPAGRLLRQDIRTKSPGLVKRVLGEFDRRPAGLVLPPGKIAKRFDDARVHRVMLKIARGLYFLENCVVLPEDTPSRVRLVLPGEDPPPEVKVVLPEEERGLYPGIFAYRYKGFDLPERLHVWAFLFWDSVACSVVSHNLTPVGASS